MQTEDRMTDEGMTSKNGADVLYFGERVRVAMARKNASTADIMRVLGVTRAFVSQLRLGQKFPSSSGLLKLCEFLDVPLEWLMEGGPVELTPKPRPPKKRVAFY